MNSQNYSNRGRASHPSRLFSWPLCWLCLLHGIGRNMGDQYSRHCATHNFVIEPCARQGKDSATGLARQTWKPGLPLLLLVVVRLVMGDAVAFLEMASSCSWTRGAAKQIAQLLCKYYRIQSKKGPKGECQNRKHVNKRETHI